MYEGFATTIVAVVRFALGILVTDTEIARESVTMFRARALCGLGGAFRCVWCRACVMRNSHNTFPVKLARPSLARPLARILRAGRERTLSRDR